MYQQNAYRIGILNTETGKITRQEEVADNQIYVEDYHKTVEDVLSKAKEISKWFDKKDTFFSGRAIWDHWLSMGFVERIKSLVEGKTLGNVVCESIAVFDGNKGTEHEFFVERIEVR